MEVWLDKMPDESKPYEADDKCPYCGALLKIQTILDCDPEPEDAECPACGKDIELLIEWEPLIGLFKKERYSDV